ncbi:MAG: hypothetical protein FWG83_00580 [Oscillospiraceae bacterium]|nr:hypothetical protein [Oscillospiraceae bacterium]
MLKHQNMDIKVVGLEEALLRQRSIMDPVDVAYVDEQFLAWQKTQSRIC